MKRFKKKIKKPSFPEPQDSYNGQELICPNCEKAGQLYASQTAYHTFSICYIDKDGDVREDNADDTNVNWENNYSITCENCGYYTDGKEVYKTTVATLTTKKPT